MIMKNAMYFAIFLYFLRKMFRRLLPVDSGAPWMVLWLLRYDDDPGPRDRYVKVYEGHSMLAACWTRDTMIRQEWVKDCILLCRKGQERDIRQLDIENDFSEIYDIMDDTCVEELADIHRRAMEL